MKQPKKPVKTVRPAWVSPRKGRTVPGPTPEMLRAATAAHLADQHIVLWGRAYDLIAGDMGDAVDWLAEQVVQVLSELST